MKRKVYVVFFMGVGDSDPVRSVDIPGAYSSQAAAEDAIKAEIEQHGGADLSYHVRCFVEE